MIVPIARAFLTHKVKMDLVRNLGPPPLSVSLALPPPIWARLAISPSGMKTPDLLLTVVGACPEVLFRFNEGIHTTLPKSVTSSTTERVRVVP